ncbi:hypothetical protein LRP49_21360 [Enterovibrio sp. ZSDZ35]|uniref:Uncharacterized protein n=1 Tax=Enterovibrio qingdaonensis TaxID=2899818 RepID=A0ABT5QRW7_9GAMM|nr:hypothetical protein [Enterovibrio sp. ZSDZ35]MDD1783730.1 hypothetical protein [Enterovibrio sp. ZSDZ35]
MKNRCQYAYVFLLLLLSAQSSAFAEESINNALSPTSKIKQNLSILGLTESWTSTDGVERQSVEKGTIYLNNEYYFAILSLEWKNETTLQASVMDSLALCTKLGIAVTGNHSSPTFKAFGSLTKEALRQPDARATNNITPYEYHVVISNQSATQTLLECGVKRL